MRTSKEFFERTRVLTSAQSIFLICSRARRLRVLTNLKASQIVPTRVYEFEQLSPEKVSEIINTTFAVKIFCVSGQFTLLPYLDQLDRSDTFISEMLNWKTVSSFLPIDFLPNSSWEKLLPYVQPSKMSLLLEDGYAAQLMALRKLVTSRTIEQLLTFETFVTLDLQPKLPRASANIYSGSDYQLEVEPGETVIDCITEAVGSRPQYTTTFLNQTGSSGVVYTFVPSPELYRQLDYEVASSFNVYLINSAPWTALETSLAETNSFMLLLAELFAEKKVDFLKLDIAGSELSALYGASQIIQRDRPKLVISLFASSEAFWQIPEYLSKLDLGYFMWIECNEGFPWLGMKLFCIPNN